MIFQFIIGIITFISQRLDQLLLMFLQCYLPVNEKIIGDAGVDQLFHIILRRINGSKAGTYRLSLDS